jgi:tryptophan synthase alpha chain
MNRIDKLFSAKKTGILSVYFTAGFPALNDTHRIITLLEKYGVDMIEIGIPFSDPVADGEVIQLSSQRALANGMNLNLLFEQLKDIRQSVSIPLLLMGYLNPVFRMGMDTFVERCAQTGIDGVILPDFPPEEYELSSAELFRKSGLYNILLITPQTGDDRIRELDRLSSGFLYMVSSYATTGSTTDFNDAQVRYFKKVKEMNLKNPLVAGFGISDRKSFETACLNAHGAITGSAFVKAINESGGMEEKIRSFVQQFITDQSSAS